MYIICMLSKIKLTPDDCDPHMKHGEGEILVSFSFNMYVILYKIMKVKLKFENELL